MSLTVNKRPITGAGIGLRQCHYQKILQHSPKVPWFEVLTDNYMSDGGVDLKYLDQIAERYPVTLHGVGLSIGSTDPVNKDYLSKLKKLVDRVKPAYVSDHLCWISIDNQYLHELMPLPYTEEAINHVVRRLAYVQDYLGTQILMENISSYLTYEINEMNEWEFLNMVSERSDCFILLDVNNVYVSSQNHGFDPDEYIAYINHTRVRQIHLAGYEDKGDYLFDTHSEVIHDRVWKLYEYTLKQCGVVPTLIEWDDKIPPLEELLQEAQKAQELLDRYAA